MPASRLLLLLPLAALAACGTPQEQCVARESRELRTHVNLADDTRDNIRRGSAIEEREVTREVTERCEIRNDSGDVTGAFCSETETEVIEEPVSINIAEERLKLRQLERRIAAQRTVVAQAQQACARAYPE